MATVNNPRKSPASVPTSLSGSEYQESPLRQGRNSPGSQPPESLQVRMSRIMSEFVQLRACVSASSPGKKELVDSAMSAALSLFQAVTSAPGDCSGDNPSREVSAHRNASVTSLDSLTAEGRVLQTDKRIRRKAASLGAPPPKTDNRFYNIQKERFGQAQSQFEPTFCAQ